ncbi:MAG: electron transfer flavoprotein subunit beta/FixA family protein [Bacteroidetes bacterium]|nr:electron transfer flavoprotein subunit beta/FixA family protein [Bacteroidota bacterium]
MKAEELSTTITDLIKRGKIDIATGMEWFRAAQEPIDKETIKKALAMGVDSGVLLKTESQLDSFGIAKALAEEIKTQGCDLVFMGKQSVDFDNQIVGQMTSAILDYSCISVVVDFKIDGQNITCEREIEGGKEVVTAQLPCIITAQKGLNEPRYASLKGIMSAKKKTIEEKSATETENNIEVIGLKKPPAKNPGRILGTDSSAVPELVRLLREEAKVI